jgi:hypothetical protein
VLLPQPLGPKMPRISFGQISSETSSSTLPHVGPYAKQTFCAAEMAHSLVAGRAIDDSRRVVNGTFRMSGASIRPGLGSSSSSLVQVYARRLSLCAPYKFTSASQVYVQRGRADHPIKSSG